MNSNLNYDLSIFALSSPLPKEKIIELAKKYEFQVFDLSSVKSKLQIKLSYFHAIEAFKENRNISKDFMLEWMVRASGKRQINEAISSIGIKSGKKIIVAFDSGKTKLTKDKIKKILNGHEIKWKEKTDSDIINKMVELEIME